LANNVFSVVPIMETVDVPGQGLTEIEVGCIHTMPENYVYHSRYDYWVQRFSQDPNVEYYPQEIIG